MRAKGWHILLPAIMALALATLGGCAKTEEGASATSSAAQESQAEETAAASSGSTAEESEAAAESTAATGSTSESAAEESSSSESAASEDAAAAAELPEEVQDMVASSEEYATAEKVGADDMVAVTADQLVDGTYEIEVDSSSSMFRIVHCDLVVADGQMTADLTLSGKGYLYVYPGAAVEAAMDSEENYIGFEEDAEGLHVHKGFPVEALNQELACAAFSKRKEKWYDRTLVFLADGLPAEAYAGN